MCRPVNITTHKINQETPGSRLNSCRLPVISGSALSKLYYWRSTHMLTPTQPAANCCNSTGKMLTSCTEKSELKHAQRLVKHK